MGVQRLGTRVVTLFETAGRKYPSVLVCDVCVAGILMCLRPF